MSEIKDIIEEAKKGNEINLCISTFTGVDNYLKILKPYGYKLASISTYTGRTNNVIFKLWVK